MYPRHPLQLPGDNAHNFGPFVTTVESVYKCFTSAVLKGLEGEKSGHVIFRSITFIAKHKINTQMGPPNLKRQMGRSLLQTQIFASDRGCRVAAWTPEKLY